MKFTELIFYLILLRPMFSLLSGYVSIIGIFTMAISNICLVLYLMKNKNNKVLFLLMIILILSLLITLIQTKSHQIDLIKLLSTCLFLIISTKKDFLSLFLKFLIKRVKVVYIMLTINLLILVLGLINSSYYKGSYQMLDYTGPLSHPHILGYIILLSLTLLRVVKKKYNIFDCILQLGYIFILLKTGARTITLICFLILILTTKLEKKKILFLLFCISLGILKNLEKINNLNFINKFRLSIERGSVLSGREVFWGIDVENFKNFNILEKLVGKGANYTYETHLSGYGLEIWSHNDYLNILLTGGLIGLILYLIILSNYFKSLYKNAKFAKVISLAGVIIGVSFFNGMYIYSDFAITLPFIAIAISERDLIRKIKRLRRADEQSRSI